MTKGLLRVMKRAISIVFLVGMLAHTVAAQPRAAPNTSFKLRSVSAPFGVQRRVGPLS